MKKHLKEYKERLEKGIGEYMEMPVSERTSGAIRGMLECWDAINRMTKKDTFSEADAHKWAEYMVNDDGTTGPHWTLDQTTAVAESVGLKFDHIYDYDWWVTMNMMWSDYGKVAEKHGVGTPEFFADLAKAFLFDKDGPGPVEKLAAYYHGVVCPDME